MLAGSNADAMRLQGLSDLSVAEDIIRRGRLFDETARLMHVSMLAHDERVKR